MTEIISLRELARRTNRCERTMRELIKRYDLTLYRDNPKGKIGVSWNEFVRLRDSLVSGGKPQSQIRS